MVNSVFLGSVLSFKAARPVSTEAIKVADVKSAIQREGYDSKKIDGMNTNSDAYLSEAELAVVAENTPDQLVELYNAICTKDGQIFSGYNRLYKPIVDEIESFVPSDKQKDLKKEIPYIYRRPPRG